VNNTADTTVAAAATAVRVPGPALEQPVPKAHSAMTGPVLAETV